MLFRSKQYFNDDNQQDKFSNTEILEPLIRSLKTNSKYKHSSNKGGKFHEYEINPMLEHTPEQTRSFRERKPYRNIVKKDSLRSDLPVTPTKSLLKQAQENNDDYHYSYQSSGRKTVRFAETSEGLLRAV